MDIAKTKFPDVEYQFDAIALEVGRTHFCRVPVNLIHEYLECNQLASSLVTVRRLTDLRGLTVVRTGEHLVFRKQMKPLRNDSQVSRASGDAVCNFCHYAYRDHPPDVEQSFLNVLCNGRRVKL